MKLTTTQILQIITWLIGVAPELAHLLPAKYAHMVLGAAAFGSLLLTQHAGNRNPDGTPAVVAYQKPTTSIPTGTGAALLLALLLFTPQAHAQTTEPLPSNFVAVGAAYDGASGNGWVSYGKSLGAGFSSFTTYDVTIASRAPLVFQYSARTGVGFDFTTVAPSLSAGGHLHIIGLGDGGTAATAAALGSAFSGGGLATWDFGAKAHHLNIVAGGRLLKTSTGGTGTVIELGIALPF